VSVGLYMDQHVPRAITVALRLRGVDVLTASEDGSSELADSALLDRAPALGRVLFTQDRDFLAEASRRQAGGIPVAGIVYSHQLQVPVGTCIADLELLATASEPADLFGRVVFLPI
jgi:hypothetical protein